MPDDQPLQSVKDALQEAADALAGISDSARLDAELLLALATGTSRAWLYANSNELLSERQIDLYCALLAQRAEGRPVAHLTGVREFWSLDLAVNEHTLIPRPETEILVEQAMSVIPRDTKQRVLDLGTGSGAIAIALAMERPKAIVVATDNSLAALEVAADNTDRHCAGRIEFHYGNWFDALPAGSRRFQFIVSNPPYIGEDERALTDRELEFEPIDALFSGRDGLRDIRKIIAGAGRWLKPDGWLLLEHGFAQARQVADLMTAAGFVRVTRVPDLAGQPRITRGQWPAENELRGSSHE